jgi:predicted RNA-binding protein with PIN domain
MNKIIVSIVFNGRLPISSDSFIEKATATKATADTVTGLVAVDTSDATAGNFVDSIAGNHRKLIADILTEVRASVSGGVRALYGFD